MNYPLHCVSQSRYLSTLKGTARETYRQEMLDERASEVSAYLNEDKKAVLGKMMNGIQLTRELWLKVNPRTEQEVYEFYTKMNTYIYELLFNECTDSRVAQLEALFERIESNPQDPAFTRETLSEEWKATGEISPGIREKLEVHFNRLLDAISAQNSQFFTEIRACFFSQP